jgi:hypothetical protein
MDNMNASMVLSFRPYFWVVVNQVNAMQVNFPADLGSVLDVMN